MSHYGPPDGPYPGQPQDPWQGRQQPHEPYEQPSDPWSGQDPWGGAPASTPPDSPRSPGSPGYGYDPGYGQPPASPAGSGYDTGYGANTGHGRQDTAYDQQPAAPAPVWSPSPPPPTKRKTSGPMLIAVVVLFLLVVGGGAVAGYYVLKDDKTTGQPTTPSTPSADESASPEPTPTASGSTASPTDARFAAKGDCVVNKGNAAKPVMTVTKCSAGAYEVLARFDGTKDYVGKCGGGKVPGYEFYYFFDSELNTLDFVLCLKKR